VADFDWGDVRFFLAVARCGTLTAAAQRLGTDHTTVGRRVKTLEVALKAKLFERLTSGYSLTPQGTRFLGALESMESAAIAAEESIKEADLSLSGRVRIGATDGFGTFFLAPRLGRLQQIHPDLELNLLAMPRVFSLSRREADLAIGLRQPVEGRLFARKLTDYELGVYGSTIYLERHPPIRDIAELQDHPFISYIDDFMYAEELDYLPRVSPLIRSRLKISNPIAQMQATLSGYGLCVMPCFMADPTPGLRRVLQAEVALQNSFWLIMHADQRRLARVRAVADHIQEIVQVERKLFFAAAG